MKFTLEIELGNDAMQTPAQIANALHDVEGRLRDTHSMLRGNGISFEFTPSGIHPFRDANGNTVGKWEVSE
jgi:fido (protein-threonine AMPylation protein)